jgi:aspartate/methionine/tyrosine aminotransferase
MRLLSQGMQHIEDGPRLPAANLLILWSPARIQMCRKEGYRTTFPGHLNLEQRFRQHRQAIVLCLKNRQTAQPGDMKFGVGLPKDQAHPHLLRQQLGVGATIGFQERHYIGPLLADHGGEVLVTCGAGEAMLDVLLCYVNPGDRVLLTNPTYNGMAQRVRLADGVQVFTDLVEERGWHLDLAALPTQARGCKVLFVMSPVMPVGTVLSHAETEALADAARANDTLLLFNASLDKIVYDGRRVISPATLPGMRERTIIVGSVSKNYNMMGWRIGWAVGPRELLKPVHDVHIFNTIMPSGLAQAGATAALRGSQEGVAASVARYERNRDVLVEGLSAIAGLRVVVPEGGYYCLANISALGVPSTTFCQQLLAEEEVAITPMVAWGSDTFGHQHVRFIFTNEPEERLREAAGRIARFVQRHYAV